MTDSVYLENPDEILDYLGPVIRALDVALDAGVSEADAFFSTQGHSLDRGLWSHIVRYGACKRLQEADDSEWRWMKLPMCGMQLARDPLTLRVGRAQNGDAPPPGRSLRKRDYYLQGQTSLGLDFGGVVMPPVSNLLFDWDVNALRERTYHLSKPAGVWESWESAVLEWRRPVTIEGSEMRFVGSEETDVLVGSVVNLDDLRSGENSA